MMAWAGFPGIAPVRSSAGISHPILVAGHRPLPATTRPERYLPSSATCAGTAGAVGETTATDMAMALPFAIG